MALTPVITLKGSNLHIGQHIVTLHGRKKTKALLEAMLTEQQQGIRRDQLRSKVYEHSSSSLQPPSLRLKEAQDGSLSKLISRSRNFLNQSLADTPWSEQIEWFVYQEKERRWQLYQQRA